MASTNKTPHLCLCQWEATDPFLREDMNGDFAKIDEAVGSRLKLELLRDWELNTNGIAQLELDVSDIDFGSYLFFILDFRQTQSCRLLFNSCEIAVVIDKEKLFFTPLKDPDVFAKYISLSDSSTSVGRRGIKYSDIAAINLLATKDSTLLNVTKIRLWGLK